MRQCLCASVLMHGGVLGSHSEYLCRYLKCYSICECAVVSKYNILLLVGCSDVLKYRAITTTDKTNRL